MFRNILKFAAVGVIGVIALNLALRLLGFVMSLLWSLAVLAALGFVIYLILRSLGVGRGSGGGAPSEDRPESET